MLYPIELKARKTEAIPTQNYLLGKSGSVLHTEHQAWLLSLDA
jgi:hypothetical protein